MLSHLNASGLTLPPINMEPDTGGGGEDNFLKGTPFQVPCQLVGFCLPLVICDDAFVMVGLGKDFSCAWLVKGGVFRNKQAVFARFHKQTTTNRTGQKEHHLGRRKRSFWTGGACSSGYGSCLTPRFPGHHTFWTKHWVINSHQHVELGVAFFLGFSGPLIFR